MPTVKGRPTIAVATGAGALWVDPSKGLFPDNLWASTLIASEANIASVEATTAGNEANTGSREEPIEVGADEIVIGVIYMQNKSQSADLETTPIFSVKMSADGSDFIDIQYRVLADVYSQADYTQSVRGIRAIVFAIMSPLVGSARVLTRMTHGFNDTSLTLHAIDTKNGIRTASDIQVATGTDDSPTTTPTLNSFGSPPANTLHLAGALMTEDNNAHTTTPNTGWTEIYDTEESEPRDWGAVAEHRINNVAGGTETAKWTSATAVYAVKWHLAFPTGNNSGVPLKCINVPEFADIADLAVVSNIKVEIEGHTEGPANDSSWQQVQLFLGSAIGDNKGGTTPLLNATTDTTLTYDHAVTGAGEWNYASGLSGLNIKNAGFGVVLTPKHQGTTSDYLYLDGVTITATYAGAAAPDINVRLGSLQVDSGDTVDVGEAWVLEGNPKFTFDIENVGNATLTLGNITISDGFTITTNPQSNTIAAESSTPLVLEANDDECGAQSGLVTINSDDPDEDPYTFTVTVYVTHRRWRLTGHIPPTRGFRRGCD